MPTSTVRMPCCGRTCCTSNTSLADSAQQHEHTTKLRTFGMLGMLHTFYSQNRDKYGTLRNACVAYCEQVKNSVTEFATRNKTSMTRMLNVLRCLYVLAHALRCCFALTLCHSPNIKDEIERLESMERYSLVSINTLSDKLFHTLPSVCMRQVLRYMANKPKKEATVQALKKACGALRHMLKCGPHRSLAIDGLGKADISVTPDLLKATAASCASTSSESDLFEALDFFLKETHDMSPTKLSEQLPLVYGRCIYSMAKPTQAAVKALAAALKVDRKKITARQVEEDEITTAIRKAAKTRVPEDVVVDIARSVKSKAEEIKESRRSRARRTESTAEEDKPAAVVVLSTAEDAVRDKARDILPEGALVQLAFADCTACSSGRTQQLAVDVAFAYDTLCSGGVLIVHAASLKEMNQAASALEAAGFAVADKPYVTQAAKAGKPHKAMVDKIVPTAHAAFIVGIKPTIDDDGTETTDTAAHASERPPTASYITGGSAERYSAVPFPGYDALEPFQASVKAAASRIAADKATVEEVKALKDLAANVLATKRDIERVLLAIPAAVFGHLVDVFSEPGSIVLDMLSLPRPLIEPVHNRQRHYWRSSAYTVGLATLNNTYLRMRPHLVIPLDFDVSGFVGVHLAVADGMRLSAIASAGKIVSAAAVSLSGMLPSGCPKLPVGKKERFKGHKDDDSHAHFIEAESAGQASDIVLNRPAVDPEAVGEGAVDSASASAEHDQTAEAEADDGIEAAGGGEGTEATMAIYRRSVHPLCLGRLDFLDDETLVEYLEQHMPELGVRDVPRSTTQQRDEEFRMQVFLKLRETEEYRNDYTLCLPNETQDPRWWEVHQLFNDSRCIGSRRDTLQSTRIKVIFDQFPWLGFTPNRYPPPGTYVSYVVAQLFHCARAAGVVDGKPGKLAKRITKCDRNIKGAAWYWEPPTARQIAGLEDFDTSDTVEWK